MSPILLVVRIGRLGWEIFLIAGLLLILQTIPASAAERLRLIIETDAGGDPDDEQSLVRFLLYANEWDIEGLIANRPTARDGENLNPERTGFGIVCRLVDAYGQCWTNLVQHDARYPTHSNLRQRTVAGHGDSDSAVQLIIAAVDKPDPRPVWYADWGTDQGAATNNLNRALDRVLQERGQAGYALFKSRLRLSSADKFGKHTAELEPPFAFWVDTFRPELNGRRWYHRFSAITARAGGFDLVRDCLTGHGALGALYPTNTTHHQKEGDTGTFLYLVPTGMNDPLEPTWGSWAGRYGPNTNFPGRFYYWASQTDEWNSATNRDNTLARWATSLQNDFKARLDWCVTKFSEANHPPSVRIRGGVKRSVRSGDRVILSADESNDPDGQSLRFGWFVYPEPSSFRGPHPVLTNADQPSVSLIAPSVTGPETLHVIVSATDSGDPALTRYQRIVLTVLPAGTAIPPSNR